MASQPKVNGLAGLAGAVDLTPLKIPRKERQHRWVYVCNFAVDDQTMSSLASQKRRAERKIAKGLNPEEGAKRVALKLDNDELISADGPGCIKCGILWSVPDGYGTDCPISDRAYVAAGSPTRTPAPVTS